MRKGDIVLIPFPFSDLTGTKKRPAVILLNAADDVVLCFITSQLKWKSEYDLTLMPSEKNGIKKESIIRITKLVTLSKDLVIGKLGELDQEETLLLNKNIIRAFRLNNSE
ncbi:MAG: type II toxin-antitoxin system PemK/MazF family toxin [Bacteroidota bacterium]